ncbi:MAG: hypothetical protein V2B18_03165 [Pseudomonadota bacterium]
MNKKVITVLTLAALTLGACLACYAQEFTSELATLERKAQVLQTQIDRAKLVSNANLEGQVQGLRNSIDHLIAQRVRIDAQIVQLQNQMDELQNQARSSLNKQVDQYAKELKSVESHISSQQARKKASLEAVKPQENPAAPKATVAAPGSSASK